MGHDNREREFEQALARHLRAAASQKTDESAGGATEDSPAATCLEAATLAAFHERMLSNEEMNAAKVHIAGVRGARKS